MAAESLAPVLDGVAGEKPFDAQAIRSARWMIQLRWLAGGVILAGTLAGAALGILVKPHQVFLIGLAVLAYNAAARLAVRAKGLITADNVQLFWLAQFLIDMLALTGIIYYCGGIESPVILFYIIHTVCASVLLSPSFSYLIATEVAALFGALVAAQAVFPALYHPLLIGSSWHWHRSGPAVGLELLAFTVAIYTSVYLTTTVTRQQHKLQQHLRARNRKILKMSQTLRAHQLEMARREKMVAIGTMAAGVAHEVGNPLASLSAIVQLLQRKDRSQEEQAHLQNLREQIQRIALIVRQLLEFARPPSSQEFLTDLDELIEKTVRMVSYSSRSRHARIESIRNPALPRVWLMPQQFQQVLVNILMNALDAVRGRDDPRVRIERDFQDGWVSLAVQDNGVGMTDDQLSQAFEPFYTTKPPGEGTGLGLAVSYRLVEQQDGQIEIASCPGRGTTVTIRYPAAQDRPAIRSPLRPVQALP